MKTRNFKKKMKKVAVLIAVLFFFTSGDIFAGWCQGKPLPEKKWFTVFETGYKQKLGNRTYYSDNSNYLLVSELGMMKNISPKTAIGGSFYFGGEDGGSNYGIRFRYRRWLDKIVSLDISPGLLIGGSDNYSTVSYPGFVGTMTLGIKDLIAFELQFQSLRYKGTTHIYNPNTYSHDYVPYSTAASNWYFGIRFGSYAAIGTVAVAAVALIIVAATWDFDMNWNSSY